ncbi:MAG: signal recognition particle receptor subunit alpha, partial [Desulfobacterales bacterium]
MSKKSEPKAAESLPQRSALCEEENKRPAERGASSGYFQRLKDQLSKTRKIFTDGFDKIFSGKTTVDDDLLEELEELLITSDIGV